MALSTLNRQLTGLSCESETIMKSQFTNIGILGLGKMGAAIASGLAARENLPFRLYGFDPAAPQLALNLTLVGSPQDLESECDILILAVKPQDMESATKSFSGKKIYISIAAGMTLNQLSTILGCPKKEQIVRVMPNLPAISGNGLSAFYAMDQSLHPVLKELLSPLGEVIALTKEELMHPVTALSGSGPAYVAAFIQALAEGGVQTGLPYPQALQMALQTVAGTAAHLKESGEHPAQFRNSVTSAGGTTIAGLHALESAAFHATVMNAIMAAKERSEEMSR